MGNYTLADALTKVSKSDTGKEQIEYIKLGLLKNDPANFYALDGIEELARNIELFGLQQPIRVREDDSDPGFYIVVSGHRRKAAIKQLVAEGHKELEEVACIVDRSTGSPALEELRLIYANSDTRRMTSADISKQAERVEMLLYQLKEEGYEFPGKMRDHVAEACKVSATKLARLKVIRDKLVYPPAVKSYQEGKLSEDAAYELARACESHQEVLYDKLSKFYRASADSYAGHRKQLEKIAKLKCKDGSLCSNRAKLIDETMTSSAYGDGCARCCAGCPMLYSCSNACYKLAEEIEAAKAKSKAAADKRKAEQRERDRPEAEFGEAVWRRFGEARTKAGLSVPEYLKALGRPWLAKDEKALARHEKREAGKGKFDAQTSMPDGLPNRDNLHTMIRMANILGCSIDYLLCRTDVPEVAKVSDPDTAQATGGWRPMGDGSEIPEGQLAAVKFQTTSSSAVTQVAWWDGEDWVSRLGIVYENEAISWCPIPKEEKQ